MGQLGNGSTSDSSVPVQVAEIASAIAVAAGGSHTCALLRKGGVRCWGGNVSGQLGDETTRDSRIPVPVIAISTATAIAAGVFHTCASLAGGRVKCWGNSESGQLSNGVNILRSTTPVTVAGITAATAVGAGLSHTCVLMADGTVRCAGGNGAGQLGDGLTPDESSDPIAARGITAAIALSVGGSHACALLADGSVRCWGANDSGQLGEGNTASLPSPRPVPGLR
jgi:alpha-tubulin suppressor-like RCC1 family protein